MPILAAGIGGDGPARLQAFEKQARSAGVLLSAIPCGSTSHRWTDVIRSWLIACLSEIVIVAEASDSTSELAAPSAAKALGRIVAAIPGRVSSPVSAGSHVLIREGAKLIRDASDALELLYGVVLAGRGRGHRSPRARAHGCPRAGRLARTPSPSSSQSSIERLSLNPAQVLLALTELELAGLLARGDGGRYVVSTSLRTARAAPRCLKG